jgi:hypothetical protein
MRRAALPFESAPPTLTQAALAPDEVPPPPTAPVPLITMGLDPLPWTIAPAKGAPVSASMPAAPVALPELVLAHAKFGGTGDIDPEIVRRAALPFGSTRAPPAIPLAPAPEPLIAAAEGAPVIAAAEGAPVVAPAEGVPVTPHAPAPPALIGPLATLEMATRAAPAPEPPPDVLPATAQAPVPGGDPLPLSAYPLVRCAAITASIARRKDDKPAVLERHELTEDRWSALEAHWGEAMKEESGRGGSDLLSAFDAAYVEQLEAERGALTIDDYARLMVSVERGTTGEVLDALDLPRGSMARLQRVWLKKVGQNAALGRQVREAMRRVGKG